MAAPPPQNLPLASTPPFVPEGWRAEWSPQSNAWFYINLSTQLSQWENPIAQTQQPLYTPPYEAGPPLQQYPPQSQQTDGGQMVTPPADGDRGLGKVIGGGILGVAGGLLAGKFIKHEIEEHKGHNHFSFWNNNKPSQSPPSDPPSGPPSGFFQGVASYIPAVPSMPFSNQNSAPPPQVPVPAPASSSHFHMPFSNNSSPPLYIHSAAYSDQDITHLVRRMVTPSQSLEINTETDALIATFGDPWPGNRKQLSIIYSYGQRPWELLASAESSDILSIIPHQPLDKNRMEFIVQDPGVKTIAIVWGTGNGLEGGKGRAAKLQEVESTGEFQATNSWMGFDGMCGPSKTAVVYYRAGNGGIGIASAREQGTCRLPWNPLAKWT